MAQTATPRARGASCLTHVESFVAVRGLTPTEAAMVAPEQIFPRLALEHHPDARRIVVLDPVNRFKPKKSGDFSYQHAFWGAGEPHPDVPRDVSPLDNRQIYAEVVEPCLPAITEGFDAAFLCIGGTDAGKSTMMFGSEKGPSGLVFLFAERVLGALRSHNDDATQLTLTLEVIECTAADQYVDLLAKPRSTRSSSTASTLLRVREDPQEGTILGGATRYAIEDTQSLLLALQQATRAQKRSRNNVVVTFRIVQEYQFSTNVSIESSMKQAVHHVVVFALIRHFGAPLVRCFDAAIEHDTGENAFAKAPTRDNAFSRLFPDLFNGLYNTAIVYAVSPHYEHTKDALATLGHANRVHLIRTAPRQRQDTSLRHLRKLMDEVKSLSKNVDSENESMQIVQNELDRRQGELEVAERDFTDRFGALNDRRGVLEGTQQRLRELLSSIAHHRKAMNRERGEAVVRRDNIREDIAAHRARHAQSQATSETHMATLKALSAAQDRLKQSLQELQGEVDQYDEIDARIAELTLEATEGGPARVEAAKASLEQAKESLTVSTAACDKTKAERDTLAPTVAASQRRVGPQRELAGQVEACQTRIAAYEDEAAKLDQEIAALKARVPQKETSNPCCTIA